MKRHRASLKTDKEGRVLVLVQGGVAWVVDKSGAYHVLAQPGLQLSQHLDMLTDPRFTIGTGMSEPGWANRH